jgi:hypothetical protein
MRILTPLGLPQVQEILAALDKSDKQRQTRSKEIAMSTDREEKREVIVNSPNNKLFPNALPFDNAPMDTSPMPNRVIAPIETNEMVLAAVEAAARERDKNEVFVDRRDPVTLRRTLENIRNGEGALRGQVAQVAAKITEVTKTVESLRKLHKQWGKLKTNSYAEGTQKQIQERIGAAEETLARFKQKERSLALDAKQNAKALKDFLASRPRPHLPTNGELLAMFAEAEALERELHQIDHLAASKAGILI